MFCEALSQGVSEINGTEQSFSTLSKMAAPGVIM